MTFQSQHLGSPAFFERSDYQLTVNREFLSNSPPSPAYRAMTKNTYSPALQIIPIYLNTLSTLCLQLEEANNRHENLFRRDFVFKRIAIEVDSYLMDATIIGKPETLRNRNWVLYAGDTSETYVRHLLTETNLTKFLHQSGFNGLVFNYPGAGCSQGFLLRQNTVNIYKAFLNFVQDEILASAIICYGFSFGGAIVSEALYEYPLKIKTIALLHHSFSNYAGLIYEQFGYLGWGCVHLSNWNLRTHFYLAKLPLPVIVLQRAYVRAPEIIHSVDPLLDDDEISPEATAAKPFLTHPNGNQLVIGISERHHELIGDFSPIIGEINKIFT